MSSSNTTVLILGSEGQLGSEFKKINQNSIELEFIFTDVDNLDIADLISLDSFFFNKKIDFIVNCAAYTNVDKAETETEKANKINGFALKNLSDISIKYKIPIIHISTDYVFDGESEVPYTEEAKVNPTSVYGKSKLLGENFIIDAYKHIIIRTSWLYSSFGHNFVKTILKLGQEKEVLNVVSDQIGSPTYAKDLAEAIQEIVLLSSKDQNNFLSGIYHYSNEGKCSWYEFAAEIMKIANISCELIPVSTAEYPTPAKRPKYSLLNKSKIKQTFSLEIPSWKESLNSAMIEILD